MRLLQNDFTTTHISTSWVGNQQSAVKVQLPNLEARDSWNEGYSHIRSFVIGVLFVSMKEGGGGTFVVYTREYLPQICRRKTEAMKTRLMTKTGTGPTLIPGESSV